MGAAPPVLPDPEQSFREWVVAQTARSLSLNFSVVFEMNFEPMQNVLLTLEL